MNSKKRQDLLKDANLYFKSVEARKNLIWEKFMKTKSKRTANLMTDMLTTLDYASDFIRNVIKNIDHTHDSRVISKAQWKKRLKTLNPNFEFIDMGKQDIVIRCKHCGAIFTRSKNTLAIALRLGSASYCKCCQKKNRTYKEKADYTAVMKPSGGLTYRLLDLKPGIKIQIKIDDTNKMAG